MPATKTTWILRISIGLCLVAAIGIGIPIYKRIHTFVVEDKIHGAFFPLVLEVYRYVDDEGKPPAALADIVPKYLPAIPESPLTEAPTYRVLPDGKSWELDIRSTALGAPRRYVWRATREFTPEETRRFVQHYHGWGVFAE